MVLSSPPFRPRPALSTPRLMARVREAFESIPDHRQAVKCDITLADALMSGLAVFALKFPSLLKFDEQRREDHIRHNLETLYGVKQAPCDRALGVVQGGGVARRQGVFHGVRARRHDAEADGRRKVQGHRHADHLQARPDDLHRHHRVQVRHPGPPPARAGLPQPGRRDHSQGRAGREDARPSSTRTASWSS